MAQAEIERLLECERRKSGPFAVLGVADDEIAVCDARAVKGKYNRLALLLHPDKCDLPDAAAAFHVAEKAYALLSDAAVLERLQHAAAKRAALAREEAEERSSSKAPPPSSASSSSFTPASHLAPQGISTDAQKAAEIRRVMQCRPADYLAILDLDPAACEAADVSRQYRRMARALHPDKCALPHVTDAFTRFEKAHKELSEPKMLVRVKAAYAQKAKRDAALAAAAASGRRFPGSASAAGSPSAAAAGPALTAEERLKERRRAMMEERQMEAARLADEADRKRQRTEQETRERADLSAQLEQQRRDWEAADLF